MYPELFGSEWGRARIRVAGRGQGDWCKDVNGEMKKYEIGLSVDDDGFIKDW